MLIAVDGRPQAQQQGDASRRVARTLWGDLREGLSVIGHSRALSGALLAGAITMLGLGAVNVRFVPLIVNDLGVRETWFGLIEFAQTAGMVLSGIVLVGLVARYKPQYVVSTSLLVLGALVGVIAGVQNVWHVLIVLFFIG